MTDEEIVANERAAFEERACTGKRRYSRTAAHRVAERKRDEGLHIGCYRCPFGDDGHYHVGHVMSMAGMEQLARVIRGLPPRHDVEQSATVTA